MDFAATPTFSVVGRQTACPERSPWGPAPAAQTRRPASAISALLTLRTGAPSPASAAPPATMAAPAPPRPSSRRSPRARSTAAPAAFQRVRASTPFPQRENTRRAMPASPSTPPPPTTHTPRSAPEAAGPAHRHPRVRPPHRPPHLPPPTATPPRPASPPPHPAGHHSPSPLPPAESTARLVRGPTRLRHARSTPPIRPTPRNPARTSARIPGLRLAGMRAPLSRSLPFHPDGLVFRAPTARWPLPSGNRPGAPDRLQPEEQRPRPCQRPHLPSHGPGGDSLAHARLRAARPSAAVNFPERPAHVSARPGAGPTAPHGPRFIRGPAPAHTHPVGQWPRDHHQNGA